MSAVETIGRTRARIRLEKPIRALDDMGGASISWLDAGPTWAQVDSIGGGLSAAFDGVVSRASYRLILRGPYDVRVGWRVHWNDLVLLVRSVRHVDIARIALECEEEKL